MSHISHHSNPAKINTATKPNPFPSDVIRKNTLLHFISPAFDIQAVQEPEASPEILLSAAFPLY